MSRIEVFRESVGDAFSYGAGRTRPSRKLARRSRQAREEFEELREQLFGRRESGSARPSEYDELRRAFFGRRAGR